jgi:hypothetical protein
MDTTIKDNLLRFLVEIDRSVEQIKDVIKDYPDKDNVDVVMTFVVSLRNSYKASVDVGNYQVARILSVILPSVFIEILKGGSNWIVDELDVMAVSLMQIKIKEVEQGGMGS